MKCARCGKDAPFFTDSYDPVKGENLTMYLCKDCQIEFTHKMAAFVRGDGEELARSIREVMDNSKPMPIMTLPELHWDMAHMKDIAKVLAWMYARGIHICGTNEEIEAAIRRIGGEE